MKEIERPGGSIPSLVLMLPPKDGGPSYHEDVIDVEFTEFPSGHGPRWSEKLLAFLRLMLCMIVRMLKKLWSRTWSGIKWVSSHMWRAVRRGAQKFWTKISSSSRMISGTTTTVVVFLILTVVIYGILGSMRVPSLSTNIPSHYWWWGLGIVVVFGLAYWLYRAGTGRVVGTTISGGSFVSLVLWVVAFVIFHWLLWSVAPEFWSAWYKSPNFFPLNAAIILALILGSQRGSIRYASYALWAIIALAVITQIYYGVPEWYAARQGSVVAPANAGASAGLLPADVVLPIIAQCESRGRQFDDEGNLITNPTSSAVGKYQIMASLHEERAKKMGFDIRTEEGNEQYARVLYAESGTKHWESDLKSRKCWEPELVALGYRGSNTFPTTKVGTWTLNLTPETPAVVSVPPGHKWELVGKIPTNGWTTDNGYRDARGNRIQIFEVVAPAKETTLKIQITKCANCPW